MDRTPVALNREIGVACPSQAGRAIPEEVKSRKGLPVLRPPILALLFVRNILTSRLVAAMLQATDCASNRYAAFFTGAPMRSRLASSAFWYQIFRIELRIPLLAGNVDRPCQLFQETLFSTEKQ